MKKPGRVSATSKLRGLMHRIGVDFHAWPSDHNLGLDYPVSRRPRYGSKVPPHPQITALLNEQHDEFKAVLAKIAECDALFRTIPTDPVDGDLQTPHWNNGWLGPLDACALMSFLTEYRPKRYLEVGSGNSTLFARYAMRSAQLKTELISIDPEPRREVDELCTRVIRSPLQDTDLSVFDDLEAGDIVFFDASHRIFMDSDTTVFLLDVLPRIKPGVLIQVHDIFWPYDYPPEWGLRYYSEQYALGLLILFASSRFQTLFPCAYVSKDDELGRMAARLTPGSPLWGYYGVSYWLLAR